MERSRYREERTLVRGLCRLPGETREEFRSKIQRIREHFAQFNLDAAEICQWLMSLRPGGKKGGAETEKFWDFFLKPETFLAPEADGDADRYRRRLFDKVFKLDPKSRSEKFPPDLLDSASIAAARPLTPTAKKLFGRLAQMNPAHRQVLLKAAAEWVMARYQRGYQNWVCQHEEWEKEKKDWEQKHPTLTEPVRQEFNRLFHELKVKGKKPRICPWKRLQEGKENCLYAGERIGKKNHGALCVKYKEFFDQKSKNERDGKNFKQHFVKNAEAYLNIKQKNPYLPKNGVEGELFKRIPQAKWFPKVWEAYLQDLNLKEDTILKRYGGRLPHCVEFGDNKDCEFNPHTELCKLYQTELDKRPHLPPLEALYREWRQQYLSGPKKPSFRYPSAKTLPLPKIFGQNFFRVDFEKSILDLRLDDMREGEFLRFRFKPWPQKYSPQPTETTISSVHLNFLGTRAKVGFRFEVPHQKSRFRIYQDEIDELRSRKYPRRAQDQEFLEAARRLLLDSFQGNTDQDLKILAVDLGERGAGAALFQGKNFQKDFPLKIIKIDKIYDALELKKKQEQEQASQKNKSKEQKKGLTKNHVGRHIEAFAAEAKRIAEKRPKQAQLRDHDLLRLSRHISWMIRDWVRLNASQIIQAAEKHQVDLIVLESLRGFSARGRDQLDPDQKRRLAFFAYGKIRRKLTEKAVERGMRTITVPYFKSSQFCAECGKEQTDKKRWENNKRKGRFECEHPHCGHKCNSDKNAAWVLGRVFWGEIQLPTDRWKNLTKKESLI